MPARLSVHLPDLPVRRFTLEDGGGAYLIGREPSCDLALDDPRLSRRHAAIERSAEGVWRLRDLGSKNGTTVDGQVAAADGEGTALADGTWIGLGGLLARFDLVATAAAGARDAGDDLRRWQTSLRLQSQIDPESDLDTLLDQLLDSALGVSGGERGFLMITRVDGELELAATRGLSASELGDPRFAGSLGAVEQAMAEGRPIALSDASADTVLGARASIISGGIRALVCLPLVAMGRHIGVLYCDSTQPGSAFTELDVEILGALASHAALALGVARVRSELVRLREEMPPATPAAAELATLWERSLPTYRGGERTPPEPGARFRERPTMTQLRATAMDAGKAGSDDR